MAITSDFDFMGLTVNDGYIKVSKLTLINHGERKVWNCVMAYKKDKDSEILKETNPFGFPYVEGEDPVKSAYRHCKIEGDLI